MGHTSGADYGAHFVGHAWSVGRSDHVVLLDRLGSHGPTCVIRRPRLVGCVAPHAPSAARRPGARPASALGENMGGRDRTPTRRPNPARHRSGPRTPTLFPSAAPELGAAVHRMHASHSPIATRASCHCLVRSPFGHNLAGSLAAQTASSWSSAPLPPRRRRPRPSGLRQSRARTKPQDPWTLRHLNAAAN